MPVERSNAARLVSSEQSCPPCDQDWTNSAPPPIVIFHLADCITPPPPHCHNSLSWLHTPPPATIAMIHLADCINPVYTNLYTKVFSDFQDVCYSILQ